MFDIITGTTDGKMTVANARWSLLAGCLATAVVSSKVTRSRVREGYDPVLGLLF